jgi:hypothetical protein
MMAPAVTKHMSDHCRQSSDKDIPSCVIEPIVMMTVSHIRDVKRWSRQAKNSWTIEAISPVRIGSMG